MRTTSDRRLEIEMRHFVEIEQPITKSRITTFDRELCKDGIREEIDIMGVISTDSNTSERRRGDGVAMARSHWQ